MAELRWCVFIHPSQSPSAAPAPGQGYFKQSPLSEGHAQWPRHCLRHSVLASCISAFSESFVILFFISRFWIIFTIIIWNSLSGRFPISSSFVWFGGHLSCSFTCWVFLCFFILFILLSLGCPFCILAVCGVLFIMEFPHCGWGWTGGLSRFLG